MPFPLLVAVSLLLLPAAASAGTLVAIGGELDPKNRAIYSRIVELAGEQPRICVLAMASSEPARSADFIVKDFQGYGASATYLDVTEENRATATGDSKILAEVEVCSGFFFLGGDQRRITRTLSGSPLEQALRARFAAGAVIAGTSGGAAALTEMMIVGGRSLDSLIGGREPASLEPGLGFAGGFLLDQHFLKRGRLGRLLGALVESGLPFGVGVDENTALVIAEEGPWQVIGASAVTLAEMPPDGSLSGVRLSFLAHGDRFDPASGEILTAAGRGNVAAQGFYNAAGLIATSDIFGKDAVFDLATYLVDSPESAAYGFTFAMSAAQRFEAPGVRLVLSKTPESAGYWGLAAGGAPYSVVRLSLSVEEIDVEIMPR